MKFQCKSLFHFFAVVVALNELKGPKVVRAKKEMKYKMTKRGREREREREKDTK